ncbi:MAG: hypothetical protein EA401_09550 [Planctomycetota bacterium]|nr:MAG: hypothetical protein EA401_09550 [Planctomycetota bacterium]
MGPFYIACIMPVPTDPNERRIYLNCLATQVRDREDQWEAAWEALIAGLMPDLQSLLRRHQHIIPGGQEGLDEGMAEVLLYWQKKLSEGTLLRPWRSTSPVAAYLCGRIAVNIARRRAIKMQSPALGGEDGELAMDGNPPSLSSSENCSTTNPVPAKVMPGEGVCTFRPIASQGVSQMHVVAGLQLFPQLNWEQDPGPAVAAQMPPFLARVDARSWRKELSQAHDQAQAHLGKREQLLRDQLSNNGKGVSAHQAALLEKKIMKVRVEQRLRPISALEMEALTGVSRDTCDKHRSRFLKQHTNLVRWQNDNESCLSEEQGEAS